MVRTTFDAFEAARGDFAWGYRFDEGAFSRERLEPDGEVGAMGGLATTAVGLRPLCLLPACRLAGARRSRDRPGPPPPACASWPCSTRRRSCPTPSMAGAGSQRLRIRPDQRRRCQAWPPAASSRRPAGLRLAHAAAAGGGRRRLRLRQPHLCADVAPHGAHRRDGARRAAQARPGRTVALAEARGRGGRRGLCGGPHRDGRGGVRREPAARHAGAFAQRRARRS